MTPEAQAEHDRLNKEAGRLARATIAVKKLEPLLLQALRGREIDALAISVLFNNLKSALGLPLGYAATPTGEVARCAQTKP